MERQLLLFICCFYKFLLTYDDDLFHLCVQKFCEFRYKNELEQVIKSYILYLFIPYLDLFMDIYLD